MIVRGAVVYDMNGREAEEADLILGALGDVGQYIFCSSAGVYLKSSQMPHFEVDAGDPKSRHKARCCCRHHIARWAARDFLAEGLLLCHAWRWCGLIRTNLGHDAGKAEHRSSAGGQGRQLDFHSTGIHLR
jgi:hypothetical protein